MSLSTYPPDSAAAPFEIIGGEIVVVVLVVVLVVVVVAAVATCPQDHHISDQLSTILPVKSPLSMSWCARTHSLAGNTLCT